MPWMVLDAHRHGGRRRAPRAGVSGLLAARRSSLTALDLKDAQRRDRSKRDADCTARPDSRDRPLTAARSAAAVRDVPAGPARVSPPDRRRTADRGRRDQRLQALSCAAPRPRADGIANPGTWSACVSAAHHVSDDADDEREALAAFQAALRIVERSTAHARARRRLPPIAADASLSDRRARATRRSIAVDRALDHRRRCCRRCPPLERPDAFTGATAYESRLLQALAGRRDRVKRTLDWEGLTYAVDLVAAEHARLRAVRLQVPSPGLDAAIVSRKPARPRVGLDGADL